LSYPTDPLKSTHGTPKYVEIARVEPEVSTIWKWTDSSLGYNSAFTELQTNRLLLISGN